MDDAPSVPEANPVRRANQVRMAVIGGAISAVLAVAAIGGYWFVTQGSGSATGGAESPQTSPSAMPTPTVSVAPVAAGIEQNHDFKSPSGNLRCSVGHFSGEPAAICQQVEINYPVPAAACPGGERGVFAGVNAAGPYWPCVWAWGEPSEVLAYDTPIEQSGITCSINFLTGVTCTNEAGHGFTMEYDAGIIHF